MASSDATFSALDKLFTALRGELASLQPRLHALTVAAAALPQGSPRARARLFSLAGFRIGAGTRLHGTPRISGGSGLFDRLVIGKNCAIEEGCAFDLEAEITIGDRVSIGPGAMILTSSHDTAAGEQPLRTLVTGPVRIGSGALLGARSVILPGVTVGEGAIVNPGAIVQKDVLPHTRVAGVPATQIEALNG